MAKFCKQCGRPLRENAKFCPTCGVTVTKTVQPAAPVCASCGGALKATSKFCPRCGQTVGVTCDPAVQFAPQASGKQKKPGLFYANIALAAVCVGLIVLGIFTIPQKKGESPTVQPGSVLAGDYGEGDYDADASAAIAADYEAIARGETLLPAAEESAEDFTPHAFSDWASEGEED
ncbi:MAG: zinc ribbon domain-containing protein [Oscillospiraceae bacterium]|nr:zinc ribbon domain-containing protein [Oscillospiraceae bacterium]